MITPYLDLISFVFITISLISATFQDCVSRKVIIQTWYISGIGICLSFLSAFIKLYNDVSVISLWTIPLLYSLMLIGIFYYANYKEKIGGADVIALCCILFLTFHYDVICLTLCDKYIYILFFLLFIIVFTIITILQLFITILKNIFIYYLYEYHNIANIALNSIPISYFLNGKKIKYEKFHMINFTLLQNLRCEDEMCGIYKVIYSNEGKTTYDVMNDATINNAYKDFSNIYRGVWVLYDYPFIYHITLSYLITFFIILILRSF